MEHDAQRRRGRAVAGAAAVVAVGARDEAVARIEAHGGVAQAGREAPALAGPHALQVLVEAAHRCCPRRGAGRPCTPEACGAGEVLVAAAALVQLSAYRPPVTVSGRRPGGCGGSTARPGPGSCAPGRSRRRLDAMPWLAGGMDWNCSVPRCAAPAGDAGPCWRRPARCSRMAPACNWSTDLRVLNCCASGGLPRIGLVLAPAPGPAGPARPACPRGSGRA